MPTCSTSRGERILTSSKGAQYLSRQLNTSAGKRSRSTYKERCFDYSDVKKQLWRGFRNYSGVEKRKEMRACPSWHFFKSQSQCILSSLSPLCHGATSTSDGISLTERNNRQSCTRNYSGGKKQKAIKHTHVLHRQLWDGNGTIGHTSS